MLKVGLISIWYKYRVRQKTRLNKSAAQNMDYDGFSGKGKEVFKQSLYVTTVVFRNNSQVVTKVLKFFL